MHLYNLEEKKEVENSYHVSKRILVVDDELFNL